MPPLIPKETRDRMTPKQMLFAVEFIKDFNGGRAAEAAGVPKKSAWNMASQWLNADQFPLVAAEIKRLTQIQRDAAEMDAKQIVAELVKIARFNPKRMIDTSGLQIPLQDLPDEIAICIKKYRIRETQAEDGSISHVIYDIEFYDKLNALEQLAKHLGLLKESVTNLNILAINWSELYKPPPKKDDPIELKIRELEDKARTVQPPPPTTSPPTPKPQNGDTHG